MIPVGKCVWTFARCEYDESKKRLWVGGRPSQVTGKPLRLLEKLLRAKGHEASFQELAEIWSGKGDMSGSYDNVRAAVKVIRRAIGENAQEQYIESVYGQGYRITCRVAGRPVGSEYDKEFIREGGMISGLAGWALRLPLDAAVGGRPPLVWEADNVGSGETHIFKIAVDDRGRLALKRELKAWKAIETYCTDPSGFVRIHNSRITTLPCFLEMEHGGINLREWARVKQAEGSFDRRHAIDVATQICERIATAHKAGLLHNDLKPSNILISPFVSREPSEKDKHWHVRIADFGESRIDPEMLKSLQLTQEIAPDDGGKDSGTFLYLAPEIRDGMPSTTASDVYSIGVILFQLISGNFNNAPTTSWQDSVDDPLLREDIELATRPNPDERPKAIDLANRLRTLDARRVEARKRQEEARELTAVREQDRRRRARRPWLFALSASLLVGLIWAILYFRETNQAHQENEFWTNLLIRQADPTQGNDANLTLADAIGNAAPAIEEHFKGDDEAAAKLHETIARGLDNLSRIPQAGEQYDLASKAWGRAKGAHSEEAVISELERVLLLARSSEPHTLEQAQQLLSLQNALIEKIAHPSPTLTFFQLEAEGAVLLAEGDVKGSLNRFAAAVDLVDKSPSVPLSHKITARVRLCDMEMRAGTPEQAEACNKAATEWITKNDGPDSGNLLYSQIQLPMIYLMENKYPAVIEETTRLYPHFSQKLGPDNRLTLQLLGTRAVAEASLEQWDNAIRDDKSAAAFAFARDPSSAFGLGVLSDAALMECRSGQTTSGERDARDAVARANLPGTYAGYAGAARQTLASCLVIEDLHELHSIRRLPEAKRLLDGLDLKALQALSGDPNYGAGVDLLQARIALLEKRYEDARQLLASIKPVFAKPSADHYDSHEFRSLEEEVEKANAARPAKAR